MKFYIQVFLISLIVFKGGLIALYLLQSPSQPAVTLPSVAQAEEITAGGEDKENVMSDASPTAEDSVSMDSGSLAFAGEGDVAENALQTQADEALQADTLAAKELFLDRREKQLLALQEEINKKLESLTRLRDEIRDAVDRQKTGQEKEVKHLIKIYSTMKPQKVAELIQKLDIDLITELFSRMKGDVVGKILSFVDTDTGARITQSLFPEPLVNPSVDG